MNLEILNPSKYIARITDVLVPPEDMQRVAMLVFCVQLILALFYFTHQEGTIGVVPTINGSPIPVWAYAAFFLWGAATAFYAAYYDAFPDIESVSRSAFPIIVHATVMTLRFNITGGTPLAITYILVIWGLIMLCINLAYRLSLVSEIQDYDTLVNPPKSEGMDDA